MFIGIIVFAWIALLTYVGILVYIYQRTPSGDSLPVGKVQVMNSDERFDVNNIKLDIHKDDKGQVIPKYLLDQ